MAKSAQKKGTGQTVALVLCFTFLAGQRALATASDAPSACEVIDGHFAATVTAATSGASADAGSCGGSEAPERVVEFTAPRAGWYTFDTLGSDYDTVLYIRGANGAELACNDDVETGVHAWSRVRVLLAANQSVRAVVDGYANQSGSFVLRVNAECPLPFRADARDLGSGATWNVAGSLDCAPLLAMDSDCAADPLGPGTAFTYTAPFAGRYEFSTEDSIVDTILSVRLGACSGAELACNDDVLAGSLVQSRAAVELGAGQTVVIAVAGKAGSRGSFLLSAVGQPFTPTASPTRTRTRTPTHTPTSAASATPTASVTPSPTRTPTASATATATPTASRTRTATQSPRSIATRSPTATSSETATATVPPPTPTATATASATVTLQLTGTPTLPSMATATGTATATVSGTPTPRPTLTPLPTVTATHTPQAWLQVDPFELVPGGRTMVYGRVAPGETAIRVWFDVRGEWRSGESLPVDDDGSFRATVQIPELEVGAARVCAAGVATGEVVCAGVTVVSLPSAALEVRVLGNVGGEAGAEVYLFRDAGAPAAFARTDEAGLASFGSLPPGIYRVRAVCRAGTDCARSLYFAPAEVVLGPGSQRSLVVRGVVPPREPRLDWAGALVLPDGLVGEDWPFAVTLLSENGGRFPSLRGLGLPPVTVRFWVAPSWPRDQDGVVVFRLWEGTKVVASVTATEQQPVFARTPAWNFPAYVADVNVSQLAPGEATLEIEVAGRVRQTYPLRGEALGVRWAALVGGEEPLFTEAKESGGNLRALARGTLGGRSTRWSTSVEYDAGKVVEWTGEVGGHVEESWTTDGAWNGAVWTDLAGKLGGQVLQTQDSRSELRGNSLPAAEYRLNARAAAHECVPLQLPAATATSSVELCAACGPVSLRRALSSALCVEPHMGFEGTVDSAFVLRGTVEGRFLPSVPRGWSERLGFCQETWWGKAELDGQMRIELDATRSPSWWTPVRPCFSVREHWQATVSCLGRSFLGASTDVLTQTECSPPPAPSLPALPVPEPELALAMSEAGDGLLLWVEPGRGADVPPTLRFREFAGGAGAPADRVETLVSGYVGSPAVAFVGPGTSLAVWVQSRLPLETAREASQGALLESAELKAVLRRDGTWQEPVALTDDSVADGSPVLVATEEGARLFWLRAEAPGEGMSVYGARFVTDSGWQMDGRLSPPAELVRELAAGFSGGAVHVAWTEVLPTGEPRLWVRSLGPEGWSGASVLALPAGLWPSGLQFWDEAESPRLLFRGVDATSGGGPGGRLYLAERGMSGWSVRALPGTEGVDRAWVTKGSATPAWVVYRKIGSGSAEEGNGDLWAISLGGGSASPAVALSTDGWGHGNLVGASQRGGSIWIADVHRQTPVDPPVVGVHRFDLLPDLVVDTVTWQYASGEDPSASLEEPALAVRVQNRGLGAVLTSFRVRVLSGPTVVGEMRVEPPLGPGNSTDVLFTPSSGQVLQGVLTIVVDPENRVEESNKENNALRVTLRPPAPNRLAVTLDEFVGDLVLQWPWVPGAYQYRIYRRSGSSVPFELVGATTTTGFRDAGAWNGTEVAYRVTTVDRAESESAPAAEVVVAPEETTVPCVGDCDRSGDVTIDELLLGVNIALDLREVRECATFDRNQDGAVTIDEILVAVGNALAGCPTGGSGS